MSTCKSEAKTLPVKQQWTVMSLYIQLKQLTTCCHVCLFLSLTVYFCYRYQPVCWRHVALVCSRLLVRDLAYPMLEPVVTCLRAHPWYPSADTRLLSVLVINSDYVSSALMTRAAAKSTHRQGSHSGRQSQHHHVSSPAMELFYRPEFECSRYGDGLHCCEGIYQSSAL